MPYQVIVSLWVQEKVDQYTQLYADYYRQLYSDTWLGNVEEMIIGQYVQSATSLNIALHNAIEWTLTGATILWRAYRESTDTYIVTTTIDNRKLFIEYRELVDTQTRIVLDIQIVR